MNRLFFFAICQCWILVAQSAVSADDFAPDQTTLPTPHPADAIVLLGNDGSHHFQSMEGSEIDWPLEDGALVSTNGRQNVNHIVSQLHFRDADIHLEFKLPEKGTGNSGVYIHGNYELQIYNSAGKKKVDEKDAGSIYGFHAPLKNACLPPGQWQVYDIRYWAPRRDAEGKITEEGSITAFLNGHKVQDHSRFGEPRSVYHPYRYGTTPYLQAIWKQQLQSSTGPLFLQDHNNAVKFRNVWVRPLDDKSFIYKASEADQQVPDKKESWTIDSQTDWQQAMATQSNLEIKDGLAMPSGKSATFQSKMKTFDKKRVAQTIVFDQSPIWLNWEPVPNVGPSNLGDAPVLLSLGPKNYWIFGRYGSGKPRKKGAEPQSKQKPFKPQSATLDGFKVPLQTTQFPNQFDAPGGLKPRLGGYHAWQSRDLVNWVHHGPVTEKFSVWVTTAEFADGKAYIYYDFPNDQDPHVYVDEDLTDGLPGKNMGMAFKDPTHGSDCGFIRDLDGKFHVIAEDWSPINASQRSWDSPLATHAVSNDGLKNFKILAPPVDERTEPTGEIKTYNHPHWAKEDPEHFKTGIAEYEVHTPNQPAFGDWAPICVGGQYYLFCDFDPEHGKPMSTAWLTSSSLDTQFKFCGNIGKGHPDPDICFAEGQFYLVTQQTTDFTSPGPWVEDVTVRVGVDTDNDGTVDHWSDWEAVKETYDYTPGFAKQIQKKPAAMKLTGLPAGFGFQFEIKLTDTTKNDSKPVLDKVTMSFDDVAMN